MRNNQYKRVTVRPFSCNWRSVEDIQRRDYGAGRGGVDKLMAAQAPGTALSWVLEPPSLATMDRSTSQPPAHPPPRAGRLRGAAGLRDLISGRPAPGTREQLTPDPQQPPAPGHRGQRLAFNVRLLGDNMLPFARKINLKSEIRRKDVTFRISSFVAAAYWLINP